MPTRIIIDTRESKLQSLLSSRADLSQLELCVEPLDIGDVQIQNADSNLRIVIERKTERDLGASIRDGRYHEQKARILASVPAQHCIYMIENSHKPTWAQNPSAACSAAAYSGAILHTMFRDGIHVAITTGVEDTADWIATIALKCHDNASKFMPRQREGDYMSCTRIKTKKAENVDPRTCFLLQLGQIPGISRKLAMEIAQRYPSWRALLQAIDEAGDTGGVKMLSQIPLIGAKKAAVILEYIKGTAETQTSE